MFRRPGSTRKIPRLDQFSYLVFDFDGVMTDDSVYLNGAGEEFVKCSRFDGAGIALVHKLNSSGFTAIDMMIVSTESNNVAKARANKLGIDCFIDVEDKYKFLVELAASKYGLSRECFFSRLVFFGNDLKDLKSMRAAAYAIAPQNSHEYVKEQADLVLEISGGEGFVREALERMIGHNSLNKISK